MLWPARKVFGHGSHGCTGFTQIWALKMGLCDIKVWDCHGMRCVDDFLMIPWEDLFHWDRGIYSPFMFFFWGVLKQIQVFMKFMSIHVPSGKRLHNKLENQHHFLAG